MANHTKLFDEAFDTRLIALVKKFPALYDRNNDDYKNAIYKKQVWQAISENLHLDAFNCSRRWVRLRDRYVVHLKRDIQNNKLESITWPHYEMCSFLREHTQIYIHLRDLIEAVRMHPILYDKNEKGYGNPYLVKLVWPIIANKIKSTPDICANEWDNLFAKYITEAMQNLSNFTKTKKWNHFEELDFLKDYISFDRMKEDSQMLEYVELDPFSNLSRNSAFEDLSNSSDEIFKDDFWDKPAVSSEEILLAAKLKITSLQKSVRLDHNYSIQGRNIRQFFKMKNTKRKEKRPPLHCETISLQDQIIASELVVTSENINICHMADMTCGKEDYYLSDNALPTAFNLEKYSNRQKTELNNTVSNSIRLITEEQDIEMEIINPTAFPKEEFVNNIDNDQKKETHHMPKIVGNKFGEPSKILDNDINGRLHCDELQLSDSNMNFKNFAQKPFSVEDIEEKEKYIVEEKKKFQNFNDKIENEDNPNIPADIKLFTELIACKITDLPQTHRTNIIRKIKQYLEIQDNISKQDF